MQVYALVVTTALLLGIEFLGLALLLNWRQWATRIAAVYAGGDYYRAGWSFGTGVPGTIGASAHSLRSGAWPVSAGWWRT